MKYTDFNELQNSYPRTPNTVSGSYKNENGEVVYTGLYPDNFVTFDIVQVNDVDLGKININPDISFQFLVKFVGSDLDKNNQYWTSKRFYDYLVKSNHDGNPYFNRELVTTAVVDFELLNKYHLNKKFIGAIGTRDLDGTGELYAEVEITETIDTIDEMLLHINWMVDPDDTELRIVKDELGVGFGDWRIATTSRLGFDESFYVPALVASGSVPEGRGDTSRDGFPVDYDARVDGVDRNGNTVRTVTGSAVPEGRGDSTRGGEEIDPLDLINRDTTDRIVVTGSAVPTSRGTTSRTGTTSTTTGRTSPTSTTNSRTSFISRLFGR